MPKIFDVIVKVEDGALGRVIWTLDDMPGVVSFNIDRRGKKANGNGHDEPRKVGRPPGSKTRKGRFAGQMTGADMIMLLLKKKPQPAKAIVEAFIADGRSASSPNSLLHTLKVDGLIGYGDDGYHLTKKGRDKARHIKPGAAS